MRCRSLRGGDAMTKRYDSAVNGQHHIWCNFWGTPLETCKQCAGLYERYPMEGMTEKELVAKHFPNVIARTETTTKPCDSTTTYATVQINKHDH